MRNTYAQQLLCDNAPETVALRIAKPLAASITDTTQDFLTA